MTELLIRLFVKDYTNVRSPQVRERYGKFAGFVGIITNLLLFLGKIIAGILFSSVSIIADAVNNLSDSASSVVTLIGFKLSGKPADAEHPYGHARMEYISGMIVSFLILMLGLKLAGSSFEKIIHPEEASFGILAVVILILSALAKGWQCLFYKKVGKKIDSPTLSATAADSLNDVFSTVAVLAGLIITRLTGFNLDGYMGLIVAVFIIVTGIKVIIETSSPLLGVAPPHEFVNHICEKILTYDGILGIHDLVVHTYGAGRCFASVHCEVSASADIMVSHDIVDTIEHDFLREENIHLVVHMDPIDVDNPRTMELRQQVKDKLQEIDPSISMHDFRVVWGNSHSNVIFDICVPFGYPVKDEELRQKVGEKLTELSPKYNAVVTVDHDYVPDLEEKGMHAAQTGSPEKNKK